MNGADACLLLQAVVPHTGEKLQACQAHRGRFGGYGVWDQTHVLGLNKLCLLVPVQTPGPSLTWAVSSLYFRASVSTSTKQRGGLDYGSRLLAKLRRRHFGVALLLEPFAIIAKLPCNKSD